MSWESKQRRRRKRRQMRVPVRFAAQPAKRVQRRFTVTRVLSQSVILVRRAIPAYVPSIKPFSRAKITALELSVWSKTKPTWWDALQDRWCLYRQYRTNPLRGLGKIKRQREFAYDKRGDAPDLG